ncbi:WD40/YVTN/BNR-like repeat-containing protein [Salmonirosea aquatica]|uniref:WD40/YVTN/BNR-like repeat-containing protein n=1 Tax=Salmonirosea aquatica TaxID=2654236 RepID=UPI0035715E84
MQKHYALTLFAVLLLTTAFAQRARKVKTSEAPAATVTPMSADSLYLGMKWRNIGPFRGGRSVASVGVPGNPMLYYMGSVGGGVWKTEDAGLSWKNITDGQLKTSSVGAIAVAASDPNVMYVGMGEHPIRGVMTSHGDGVYKSTDAGKTWKHLGLPASRHIAAVRIHPQNPDLVYVAVQGAAYGATAERGIYRSADGGKSWQKILYVDENTGCADLSMDATNPRILYAGMWDHRRLPWKVVSGGQGSALYKSTDGGDTWTKLTKGLPKTMGKVAVSVSPANPERVYANIEAEGEKGGIYRSDDAGKTWTQTSNARVTVARAWYYIEIEADPQNADVVYCINAPVLKSSDGGRTFKPMGTPTATTIRCGSIPPTP